MVRHRTLRIGSILQRHRTRGRCICSTICIHGERIVTIFGGHDEVSRVVRVHVSVLCSEGTHRICVGFDNHREREVFRSAFRAETIPPTTRKKTHENVVPHMVLRERPRHRLKTFARHDKLRIRLRPFGDAQCPRVELGSELATGLARCREVTDNGRHVGIHPTP